MGGGGGGEVGIQGITLLEFPHATPSCPSGTEYSWNNLNSIKIQRKPLALELDI